MIKNKKKKTIIINHYPDGHCNAVVPADRINEFMEAMFGPPEKSKKPKRKKFIRSL